MKFIAYNKVRIHDTDLAGILYFPKIYRFAEEAAEDFFESRDLSFEQGIQEGFMWVIVHSEADYKVSMRHGDKLEIHLHISHIGNSSFTFSYTIYKQDGTLMGTVKTTHVTLNVHTRTKISIPPHLRKLLQLYHKTEKD